jgi:hypothetical protein
MMTVHEFCDKHDACPEGREWAEDQELLDAPMSELWARDDLRYEWRLWILTRPGVATDRDLRLFACRCVRETPLPDGRTVWDLLTDERSRTVVEVSERFANGQASQGELAAAGVAAGVAARAAAGDAAWAAAWAAAGDAAWDAAWAAARAAAWAAAMAWQCAAMRELTVSFDRKDGEG